MSLQEFLELVKKHSQYRKGAINLIASENCSSPLVRAMLASDLGNRYSADFYGGTKYIQKIIAKTESYIRELFDANHSLVSALSGNLCDLAVILGLTKSNDKIMVVNAGSSGGYPLDYDFFGRKKMNFHFSENDMNLLIEENIEEIKKIKPKLVIFGASFIPFPEPVKEITQEFQKKKNITFAYDGSHVLGLIAGKQFQDPLNEGAHILLGSTHKSFPGPQGGIIVTNDLERYEKLQAVLDLDLEKGIRLVDNNHPNRIAALGVTALEMIEYGKSYAEQIIKNSKALAKSLHKKGVPVKFANKEFTESHQVIIKTEDYSEGNTIKTKAEKYGLIIDSGIRLGTSEITRLGMKELEAKEIGTIFSKIYHDEDTDEILGKIAGLAELFQKTIYCFEDIENIPL
ncbi:MAG: hypothetical protein ACFFDW_15235 [Candidatus Thorarchaeota archaeon]